MTKETGRKRICVITLWGVKNYGSVLQSLATQHFFEQMGCDVEFLNYQRDDYRTIWGTLHHVCKKDGWLKKIPKGLIYLPTILRWFQMFGSFRKRNLNISTLPLVTDNDFKDCVPFYDIYCTGSDQVWNSKLNGGLLPHFFLDFAPDYKTLIAFSASFGKEKLDDWEKDETRRLLERYDYITCREESGAQICRGLGLENVCSVLDPTLLVDRSFWDGYIGKRACKEPYLLVYQLHKEPDMAEYVAEAARRRHLRVVRVCYRYDEMVKSGYPLLIPSVENLLGAIRHADMVITDSFHVTAFSTNFHRSLISMIPAHQFGGRLKGLLDLVGLSKMAISDFSDFSPLDFRPDWDAVDAIYAKEREKARQLFAGIVNK